MHHRKRIFIPIALILIFSIVGVIWYFTHTNQLILGGKLNASGSVEATEVMISSELSGRIAEVLVEKGQRVATGDLLFRLDDELLQSQRQRALTALESAQANLRTAQAGLEAARANLVTAQANAEAAMASSQAELLTAQQALDNLDENADVVRAEAERKLAAANRALRDAQYLWDNFTIPSSQDNLSASEAISLTLKSLEKARRAFEPYKNEASGNATREDLKDALDEAQSDYDTAVRRMELETSLAHAKVNKLKAELDLSKVFNGPDSDQVAKLNAQIAAIQLAPRPAQEAVEQSRINIDQAQAHLDQAQTGVFQAQAELDLVDLQIKKLSIYAPSAGVVLSRNIQPGEVVQAGAPVMNLGEMDQLKITVFIPEDSYGQIKLGEEVEVTVDSFPTTIFLATVSHIADQAEFTPRNVQTSEGRKTTVFAVELAVSNKDGKLKPGMPADVCFNCR